jgi:hypothetical protein
VPKTAQRVSESCPHEVRPGTTVCLHCRHTERLAARARRRRYMLRSSAVGAVAATLGVAGVLGAMVIRGRTPRAAAHSSKVAAVRQVQEAAVGARVAAAQPAKPDLAVARIPSGNASVSSGNVAIAPAVSTPATRSAMAPVLPEGRSDLPDGVSAMRSGGVVVLDFDTKLARTRLPDKFERFVRATLPVIYGAVADSALVRIPQGALARQGDLIDDLPSRGMRIPAPDGWTITLYPMTRPGQDGPLVTRYRVVAIKG